MSDKCACVRASRTGGACTNCTVQSIGSGTPLVKQVGRCTLLAYTIGAGDNVTIETGGDNTIVIDAVLPPIVNGQVVTLVPGQDVGIVMTGTPGTFAIDNGTWNGSTPDGTLFSVGGDENYTYLPPPRFEGGTGLTFTVDDTDGTTSAEVTIPVFSRIPLPIGADAEDIFITVLIGAEDFYKYGDHNGDGTATLELLHTPVNGANDVQHYAVVQNEGVVYYLSGANVLYGWNPHTNADWLIADLTAQLFPIGGSGPMVWDGDQLLIFPTGMVGASTFLVVTLAPFDSSVAGSTILSTRFALMSEPDGPYGGLPGNPTSALFDKRAGQVFVLGADFCEVLAWPSATLDASHSFPGGEANEKYFFDQHGRGFGVSILPVPNIASEMDLAQGVRSIAATYPNLTAALGGINRIPGLWIPGV